MGVQTLFRVKWLGKETEEICDIISQYQPLILISPAPRMRVAPPGYILLPRAISLIWDLRSVNPRESLKQIDDVDIRFETIDLTQNVADLSSVYEFYFNVYLKHTAFGYNLGTATYSSIEPLHEAVLNGKFISFTRAFIGEELVGGGLIKRASLPEDPPRNGCISKDESEAGSNPVRLDMVCASVEFEDIYLTQRILCRLIEWAQEAGFDRLWSQPLPPVSVSDYNSSLSWMYGSKVSPFPADDRPSLLYCDFARCSYFRRDFFYFSLEKASMSLHYVANAPPHSSQIRPLLDSFTGIEKIVYTRKREVQQALSGMDVECVLLR